MITGYRILTYLLLPFAAILGMLTILTLVASFANIAGLLPAFTCGATVIYIVLSFNFLHKTILSGQPSKPSLFDWIRVNGFVALFMGILFVFQGIYFRDKPEVNEQLQIQMETLKADMPDGEQMPEFQKLVKWVLNFMLVAGILLTVHVLATFSFLKKFAGFFRNS